MKIDSCEILHVRLPFRHHFETSFKRSFGHEAVIVKLGSDGLFGYGESAAGSGPFYSHEDVHTAWHIIRNHLAPALKEAKIKHPSDVGPLFHFVRGHPMAKAGVEMALWDVLARTRRVPLSSLYRGGTEGPKEIPTGISLGIEDTIEQLIDRIRTAHEEGYHRIKMKIKPGWDVDAIARIRGEFPSLSLMADANAAYTLADAATLKRLDDFDLMMIEQPLSHDDLLDHAALQKEIRTPICLDESIKSVRDAESAAKLGACRVVNIKQARVGGPTEAIRVHDACRKAGIPVWCGGLLETGIGRLHNVALSTLPNFMLPGDVSASGRYYEKDVIDPPVELTERGTIRVPTTPGIGHEIDEKALSAVATKRERLW
jgi:O-succinylbenzoate synthase